MAEDRDTDTCYLENSALFRYCKVVLTLIVGTIHQMSPDTRLLWQARDKLCSLFSCGREMKTQQNGPRFQMKTCSCGRGQTHRLFRKLPETASLSLLKMYSNEFLFFAL